MSGCVTPDLPEAEVHKNRAVFRQSINGRGLAKLSGHRRMSDKRVDRKTSVRKVFDDYWDCDNYPKKAQRRYSWDKTSGTAAFTMLLLHHLQYSSESGSSRGFKLARNGAPQQSHWPSTRREIRREPHCAGRQHCLVTNAMLPVTPLPAVNNEVPSWLPGRTTARQILCLGNPTYGAMPFGYCALQLI
jgi:hypothetical protein